MFSHRESRNLSVVALMCSFSDDVGMVPMEKRTSVHFFALEPSRRFRFSRVESVESTLGLISATLMSFFSRNRVSMLTSRSGVMSEGHVIKSLRVATSVVVGDALAVETTSVVLAGALTGHGTCAPSVVASNEVCVGPVALIVVFLVAALTKISV